ncbi:murein transglycosylase A [Azospirillum halopraeferens]|uniref:murein transglycosylase A n=1 Tax=Azospirillum halopraeferens TaxID=34010 RepID=UPI00040162D2|nr:murein transglycosylase A [Azospirillum halopraeferens]
MANAVRDGVARKRARMCGAVAAALAAAVLTGCTATGPASPVAQDGFGRTTRGVPLDRIAEEFRPLPGWGEDDHAGALAAFNHTCRWVNAQAPDRQLGSDPRAGTVAQWRPACAVARSLPRDDAEAARTFFESHFTPVSLSTGEDGLFTGYYEPELNGSWTRTARHTVPIYRTPPRPKGGYPSRARIAAGALAGKGLEILWVDDPIGAFFMEIQGSGRVRMTDGTVVGLGYAGQNGHRYFPVGRELIDRGIATPEEMSLQFIRRWMEANPAEAQKLKNLNPSYVFFKLRNDGGARGARNMELTPGRSLAVDPAHVPLGAPLWVELKEAPVPGGEIRRLVVAQDTGGAIKGPVRGDLFWGVGPEAEEGAGLMKARGRYTMLVPRLILETAQNR